MAEKSTRGLITRAGIDGGTGRHAQSERWDAMSMEPEVARWLIGSSGWNTKDLAKAMRIHESQIADWMEGKEISMSELKRLALHIKRPVTLFLLKKPLKERNTVDYRKRAGEKGRPAHETVVAIRKARWLQSVAVGMMEDMGMSTQPKIGSGTTTGEPPEDAARREAKRLGVAVRGSEAAGAGDLYGELRAAVESLNVPVFQASIDVGEMRGLALSGAEPNAILVSSRDGYEARRFSLLHEYGHLLLRKGDGMCNTAADEEEGWDDGDGRRPGGAAADWGSEEGNDGAERWCNRFAAEALMPEKEFGEEIRKNEGGGGGPQEIIERLAERFRTSRQAATIRAINTTGGKRADDFRRLLGPPGRGARGAGERDTGGQDPAESCISGRGDMFVSLVFDASERGEITTKDVIDYLGVGSEWVDEVRGAARWYG